jgi:hypothetical protein
MLAMLAHNLAEHATLVGQCTQHKQSHHTLDDTHHSTMTRTIFKSVSRLCRKRKASQQHAHLWPPTRPVIADARDRKDSRIMATGGKLLIGRSTWKHKMQEDMIVLRRRHKWYVRCDLQAS